jgi:hypothetical protein
MYFFRIVFENKQGFLSNLYFGLIIDEVLLLIRYVVSNEVRHPVMEHTIQVRRGLQIQQILIDIVVLESQFEECLNDKDTLELHPPSVEQHSV